MKEFNTDVPVAIQLWIRHDMQRKQFEILKKARPSTLFLISDGGRNEAEWEDIKKNREMFDTEIDWNCTIYRMYSDHNMGLYQCQAAMMEFIFSHTDRCIILEDDQLPSISFFPFCAELLERYKDDQRIYAICGMNHEGISEEVTSDYFFSRFGSIWGYAIWKRSYEEYKNDAFRHDPYTLSLLEESAKTYIPAHRKQIEKVAKFGEYDGHTPGNEFYMNFMIYAHSQMLIIPKKNMITNIGCDENATHSASLANLPKGIRRLYNMERYEYDFPLNHPDYVFPDTRYEKKRNRIMGFGHPLVTYYRYAETVFLHLRSGDSKQVMNKIRNFIRLRTGKMKEH